MRRPPWSTNAAEAVLMAALGALIGAAYLPLGFGPLLGVLYAAFLWATQRHAPAGAYLSGQVCGTAAWGVGIYWFCGTIQRFTGQPAPVAALEFLLVSAYSGMQFGIMAGASRWLTLRVSRRLGLAEELVLPAVAAPVIVCVDAWFPLIFPVPLAFTQLSHLPSVQILELAGPAGPAWLVGSSAAALCAAVMARLRPDAGSPTRRRCLAVLAAAAAALMLNEAWGRARMRQVDAEVRRLLEEGRSLRVAVVQGLLPMERRLNPEYFEQNLGVYTELTRRALSEGGAQLVVWPQSSYERTVRLEGRGWTAASIDGLPLERWLRRDVPAPADVLLCSEGESSRGRHYVALLKGPDNGWRGVSAKRFPTPLGEFIPGGKLVPALYRLLPTLRRIHAGPQRVLTASGGARLGVYICYDAVTPASARDLASAGAQVLVNPASDAWYFGEAVEPEQHMKLASLRAIENRRFLFRAMTSGISCAVDPVGRVLGRVEFGERGWLVRPAALMDRRTLYSRFPRLPVVAAAACLTLALALALLPQRAGSMR